MVDEEAKTITAHGELDASDSLGVTVEADVEIRTDSMISTWDWLLVRRPLEFTLTLGCTGTAASAHLVGPTWAEFDLGQVEQDPALCNPPPRMKWNPASFRIPSVLEVMVFVGAGIVIGSYLDTPP